MCNKTIFIVNSLTVVVTLLCHDPNPRLYCMCTPEISTPENSREKLHEDAAFQFKFVHGCTCKTHETRLLVNRSNVFYKLSANISPRGTVRLLCTSNVSCTYSLRQLQRNAAKLLKRPLHTTKTFTKIFLKKSLGKLLGRSLSLYKTVEKFVAVVKKSCSV